jgi:hypothetical protein
MKKLLDALLIEISPSESSRLALTNQNATTNTTVVIVYDVNYNGSSILGNRLAMGQPYQ